MSTRNSSKSSLFLIELIFDRKRRLCAGVYESPFPQHGSKGLELCVCPGFQHGFCTEIY